SPAAAGGLPVRAVAASISSPVASDCTACQRLNGSESWAARNLRSSAPALTETLIGAAKPRLSESAGRSAIPVKVKLSAGLAVGSTPRSTRAPAPRTSGRGAPAPPPQPRRHGERPPPLHP